METRRVAVAGAEIELREGGDGPPVVFLHGGFGLAGHERFLDLLAARRRVVAPALPGFETSELPRAWNGIGDLAYWGLDLLRALDLRGAVLAGACLGGWVAAEMAARATDRLAGLVLVGALGAKFGGHLDRDIADIHAMAEADAAAALYADPARARRDPAALSDDELTAIARNRESFALFGWKPYMHSPELGRWLHRIDVPAALVWGAEDGMTTPDYGRRYAAAIPGASFETIPGAGHYPGLERPEALASLVAARAAEMQGETGK